MAYQNERIPADREVDLITGKLQEDTLASKEDQGKIEDTVRATRTDGRKKAVWMYGAVKRGVDIVLSLVGGVVFLIPFLVICLVIVLKDFGNPFFTQTRVGKDGKEFSIVKLRSMKKRADHLQEMLDEEHLREYYSEYKLVDDPRLIGWRKADDGKRCFGAWLRRLSMDELPQIYWNILIKGNMSIIGPRPILPCELEANYTREQQEKLLSIKPGLTGYWQAYARNNAGYETGERQRMELYYVEHRSAWLDLKILFATVGAVISKAGAR